MRRPEPKKPDALTLLAMASARDRRRRSAVPILVGAAAVLAVLTFAAWLLWPTPRPRQVVLAAYDVLVTGDEEAELRARIEAADEADAGRNVAGYDVYFREAGGPCEAQAATGSDGSATVRRVFAVPPGGLTEVLVRCPGTDSHRGAPDASCRLFHWPADAPLLVVDADSALAAGDAGVLFSSPNLDVRPRSGAVAALRALAKKYRIVYVSKADRPALYLKLAAWLKLSRTPAEQFPDGPVLASAAAWEESLAQLKTRFAGEVVAVTGSAEEARASQEAGVRCLLLGDSWAELEKQLR